MDRLPVDYWSDPLCVWACLAEPKLERLIAAHPDRLAVRHRVVPVFGSVPARFDRGAWHRSGPAGIARHVDELAERFDRPDVSGRIWLQDPPASSWGPSAAAAAVGQLEAAGELPEGRMGAYLRRLRELMFVEARNPARLDVQRAAAADVDVPWEPVRARLEDGRALAAVWEAHEERQQHGIQGSPTWVFDGGRATLYGNVHEGVLQATVDQLLAGLGAGASRC